MEYTMYYIEIFNCNISNNLVSILRLTNISYILLSFRVNLSKIIIDLLGINNLYSNILFDLGLIMNINPQITSYLEKNRLLRQIDVQR